MGYFIFYQLPCVQTYLINVIEVGLHALYRDIFVRLGRLRLENFRECALALLANQSVLYIRRQSVLE